MKNNLEEFELYFEVDVNTPYKKSQKELAIHELITQLKNTGCTSVLIKDSYYIDRKSAEAPHSFVLIMQIVAPIVAVTASILAIRRELKAFKNKGNVFLKDKDGKHIKIDETMTADEAREKLNESKEKS